MMFTNLLSRTKIVSPQFSSILALTLVFLSACSGAPDSNEYFPLEKGISYSYKITTEYPDEKTVRDLTIANLGEQKSGDKSYFIRRTSSGIDYYINRNEKGVYREGLRTLVEFEPRLDKRFIIKRPYSIGTEWQSTTSALLIMRVHPYRERVGDQARIPMTIKITGSNETVTVPAGTFENCLKLTGAGSFKAYTDPVNGETDIPISVEEWYAKGIGLVKQVRHELDDEVPGVLNTPVFIGGKATLELRSVDF